MSFRVALAQVNSTVGDLAGNTAKILAYLERAKAAGAALVAFPELAVTGYPPEDLLLKPRFIKDNLERIREIAAHATGITAVVGFVDADDDIYNAAAILHDGAVAGVYRKTYLPNYGVFDEERYFRHGSEQPVYVIGGVRVGVSVCEDIWYPTGPAATQAAAGAHVLVNINASPYHIGKREQREKMLATRAFDNQVIVCYLNAVGGQDELVFDGASLIFDQGGRLLARGRQFEEDLVVSDLDVESVFRGRLHDPRPRHRLGLASLLGGGEAPTPRVVISEGPEAVRGVTPGGTPDPASGAAPGAASGAIPGAAQGPALAASAGAQPVQPLEGVAEIYAALVLGTRDYARKNGFAKVVIGLSGGIDSSLVATIAADALGSENVIGVSMPSRYSSQGSRDDAVALAGALGIKLITIPIEKPFQAYLDTLEEVFRGREPDITEENLQARIRGNLWMALSNKFGYLVLTGGNKSEMATGYATLYGDMAGGFAVIKDVPKTMVYRLAEYRNGLTPSRPPIPENALRKAPSAELRPDQTDQDTLPPYPVLDGILQAYVEEDRSVEEIVALGYSEDLVRRVIRMVDRSEYKRRQAPPGIKVTPRAFGRDRRLPITNRYS